MTKNIGLDQKKGERGGGVSLIGSGRKEEGEKREGGNGNIAKRGRRTTTTQCV